MSGNAHREPQGKQIDPQNISDMGSQRSFESEWRSLRPRVLSTLVGRGASRDVAEDVAQETAIRLLNNWHLLDPERPAWPFVRRIALNCLIDRHRAERFASVEDIPDGLSPHDVEEASFARARLSAVWRAMAGLSARERSILLAEVGLSSNISNSSATKMARYRARQKLSAAVGRSGAFAGIPVTWRRVTHWCQVNVPAAVDVGAAAGIAVIVSAAALTFAHPGRASTRADRPGLTPQPVPNLRVVSSVARMEPSEQSTSSTAGRSGAAPAPARSPSPAQSASTSAQAGPARAETGQTEDGSIYLKVCTGENTEETEDDFEVTITLYDGGQGADDRTPECKHGNESEARP